MIPKNPMAIHVVNFASTFEVCEPKTLSVMPPPNADPRPSLRGLCMRTTKTSIKHTITCRVIKIGRMIDIGMGGKPSAAHLLVKRRNFLFGAIDFPRAQDSCACHAHRCVTIAWCLKKKRRACREISIRLNSRRRVTLSLSPSASRWRCPETRALLVARNAKPLERFRGGGWRGNLGSIASGLL